jgi:hypothetical protein
MLNFGLIVRLVNKIKTAYVQYLTQLWGHWSFISRKYLKMKIKRSKLPFNKISTFFRCLRVKIECVLKSYASDFAISCTCP